MDGDDGDLDFAHGIMSDSAGDGADVSEVRRHVQELLVTGLSIIMFILHHIYLRALSMRK